LPNYYSLIVHNVAKSNNKHYVRVRSLYRYNLWEYIGIPRSDRRSPCQIDSQLQKPELQYNDTTNSLLYVGSLNWEANIDGLLWFIKNVWPLLIKQQPDLTLTIIGKNPDNRLLEAAHPWPTINFPGFVKDLEPYFIKSRIFIAPLQYGAGMKVKVLNAMCRGIPVVTTAIGSEGIELENMKHLAISNNSQNMANIIFMLLTDSELWTQMQKNSRQLIREKYTWKKLFSHMNSELELLFEQIDGKNKNRENNKEQSAIKTPRSSHWHLA